jgi:hypothetical protein
MITKVTSIISAEFGYYPEIYNVDTEQFSVRTLDSFADNVAQVENSPNVYDSWIYEGKIPPERIFNLPKTHVLTLKNSTNNDDLDFVVWCLSLFTGMRLTTKENGFIDATPIQQEKLVDFILCSCTLEDVINLALDYLKSEKKDPLAPKHVAATIHCLFLAQYPKNLQFEKFHYLYMALDTCYKLVESKYNPKRTPPHAQRVEWTCKKLNIPVPSWAKTKSDISEIRNDAIHEGLFGKEPLGFSLHGKKNLNKRNLILEMQNLICRLLVAVLGKPEIDYVQTPVNSFQIEALKLNSSRK